MLGDREARTATHADATVTNATLTTNRITAPNPNTSASIRSPGLVSIARARPIGASGDDNAAKTKATPAPIAPMRSVRDFDTWKGKLAGKIVLVSWPEPPKDATDPPFVRLADVDLQKLNKYVEPVFDPAASADLVFAKNSLAAYCREQQIAVVAYDDLGNVAAYLETALRRGTDFSTREPMERIGA